MVLTAVRNFFNGKKSQRSNSSGSIAIPDKLVVPETVATFKDLLPEVVDTEDCPRYPPFATGIPVANTSQILQSQYDQLNRIRETLKIGHSGFDELVMPIIIKYAEYIHLLPASKDNHHRGAGGLFRHSLEVAQISAQLSGGVAFGTPGDPIDRRKGVPRWELASFFSGLFHDAGKPLVDIVVTDRTGKNAWDSESEPLLVWARKAELDRYFIHWRTDRVHKRHEEHSIKMAHALFYENKRVIEYFNELKTTRIYSQMTATINALSTDSKMSALVMEADKISTQRDLKASPAINDSVGLGVPVDRYVFSAMRQLINKNKWLVNKAGAKVWVTNKGLFVSWKQSVPDIIRATEKDKIPGIPRDPDTLAQMLIDRGLAVPNIIHKDGQEFAYLYWMVALELEVRGGGKSSLTLACLKLASLESLFSGEPPAIINVAIKKGDGKQPEAEVAEVNQPEAKAVASAEQAVPPVAEAVDGLFIASVTQPEVIAEEQKDNTGWVSPTFSSIYDYDEPPVSSPDSGAQPIVENGTSNENKSLLEVEYDDGMSFLFGDDGTPEADIPTQPVEDAGKAERQDAPTIEPSEEGHNADAESVDPAGETKRPELSSDDFFGAPVTSKEQPVKETVENQATLESPTLSVDGSHQQAMAKRSLFSFPAVDHSGTAADADKPEAAPKVKAKLSLPSALSRAESTLINQYVTTAATEKEPKACFSLPSAGDYKESLQSGEMQPKSEQQDDHISVIGSGSPENKPKLGAKLTLPKASSELLAPKNNESDQPTLPTVSLPVAGEYAAIVSNIKEREQVPVQVPANTPIVEQSLANPVRTRELSTYSSQAQTIAALNQSMSELNNELTLLGSAASMLNPLINPVLDGDTPLGEGIMFVSNRQKIAIPVFAAKKDRSLSDAISILSKANILEKDLTGKVVQTMNGVNVLVLEGALATALIKAIKAKEEHQILKSKEMSHIARGDNTEIKSGVVIRKNALVTSVERTVISGAPKANEDDAGAGLISLPKSEKYDVEFVALTFIKHLYEGNAVHLGSEITIEEVNGAVIHSISSSAVPVYASLHHGVSATKLRLKISNMSKGINFDRQKLTINVHKVLLESDSKVMSFLAPK